MSRPAVSVVMPFAGTFAEARAAVASLLALEQRAGDELIVADNSGTVPATPGVNVVPALAERSPAHARNAGAAYAANDFILFLDADCLPPPDLLDAYFADAIAPDVGALAGEIRPAPGATTLGARYATGKSFLGQRVHLAHPFRPRAAAANLLVRRAAFEAVGGFYEGLRAAEDTDVCWRLQGAGWRLELCERAAVEHRYRASVSQLRRQWRGYAAGRAWLSRRYDGFEPEPAVVRGLKRVLARRGGLPARAGASAPRSGFERVQFLALDVVLACEELVGLQLSNRPARSPRRSRTARSVLVVDRFPPAGDAEAAGGGARVEAAARPAVVDVNVSRAFDTVYREDDGVIDRAWALARLTACRPGRVLVDVIAHPGWPPSLAALAPAALRLLRDPDAELIAGSEDGARSAAARLGELASRTAGDIRQP